MFKRLFVAFFALASPLLANLPIDPAYRIGQLENGITYYLQHHRERHVVEVDDEGASTNRAALRLVVPIGSVQEEEGEEGVAHWVEHLLFRGTRSLSRWDIIEFFDAIGAGLGHGANAYTGMDQTVYQLDVPVDNPQRLTTALQLMAEWISCATLRDGAIEAERLIVIEERRRGLGAGDRLSKQAIAEVLADSKYAERRPIGLLETLENASPETVRGFYKKWYTKVPVAVVVVGDFDLDAVEELIIETFGSLSDRIAREEIPSYPIPLFKESRFAIRTDPEIAEAVASLIFKRNPLIVTTEADYRKNVVAMLALAMVSERLATVGFSGDCLVSTFRPVRPLDLFCIDAKALSGDVFSTLTQLTAELSRLQKHGFTHAELERAIRRMISYMTLYERASIQTSCVQRAEAAVSHYLHGHPLLSIGYEVAMVREILPAVSLEEVSRCVRQLDLHRNNVVMITLPEGHSATPATAQTAYLAGVHANLDPYVEPEGLDCLLADRPLPGTVASESFDPDTGRTALHFDNGLTLHLLPNTHDEGMVLFDGVALGGLSDFEPRHLPTARLVEPLLEESGIGPHSNVELARLLAGQEVSLCRAYNTYSRSIHGAGSAQAIEALFQLIHLAFTQGSTNQEAFEKVRQREIIDAREAQLSPERRLRLEARALNHSDHPYFVPSTLAQLQQADYPQANAIAKKAFSNPAEFTFVFAGDFDLDTIKRFATTYLGSIPAQEEPPKSYRPLHAPFPTGIHRQALHCGQEDKSIVQLTFPLTLDSPTADQLDLARAAANIIAGRIFHLMRGALDATYDVRCQPQFISPETSKGLLSIRFACDPQDAKVFAKMAVRELRLLKAHGPTAKELTHLIRHQRRQTAKGLQSNTFLVQEVVRHTLHQWDMHGLAHIPERVNALSKPAVTAQIRNMLPLDNYTCVILFPELAQNSVTSYRAVPQGG